MCGLRRAATLACAVTWAALRSPCWARGSHVRNAVLYLALRPMVTCYRVAHAADDVNRPERISSPHRFRIKSVHTLGASDVTTCITTYHLKPVQLGGESSLSGAAHVGTVDSQTSARNTNANIVVNTPWEMCHACKWAKTRHCTETPVII